MTTIPTITEEDIREFVGERNYRLGQDYFSSQAIFDIRGRENYHEASRFLVKMRDLYLKLGENEQWTSYVTGLRERNKSLRALKEEMAKVGL